MTINWHNGADYDFEYAPTADPRVFACVQYDDDADAPDAWEDGGVEVVIASGWSRNDLGGKSPFVRIIEEALNFFRESIPHVGDGRSHTDRYLRIMHNVTSIHHPRSSIHQYDNVIVLGVDGEDATGTAEAWRQYMDGEVYGVGTAVFPNRVSEDETPDPDEIQNACDILCWGYIGEDYAKAEALEFAEYESRSLPPMLPMEGE